VLAALARRQAIPFFPRIPPAPVRRTRLRHLECSAKIFPCWAAPSEQFSCNNACARRFGWTNLP